MSPQPRPVVRLPVEELGETDSLILGKLCDRRLQFPNN